MCLGIVGSNKNTIIRLKKPYVCIYTSFRFRIPGLQQIGHETALFCRPMGRGKKLQQLLIIIKLKAS